MTTAIYSEFVAAHPHVTALIKPDLSTEGSYADFVTNFPPKFAAQIPGIVASVAAQPEGRRAISLGGWIFKREVIYARDVTLSNHVDISVTLEAFRDLHAELERAGLDLDFVYCNLEENAGTSERFLSAFNQFFFDSEIFNLRRTPNSPRRKPKAMQSFVTDAPVDWPMVWWGGTDISSRVPGGIDGHSAFSEGYLTLHMDRYSDYANGVVPPVWNGIIHEANYALGAMKVGLNPIPVIAPMIWYQNQGNGNEAWRIHKEVLHAIGCRHFVFFNEAGMSGDNLLDRPWHYEEDRRVGDLFLELDEATGHNHPVPDIDAIQRLTVNSPTITVGNKTWHAEEVIHTTDDPATDPTWWL